MEFKCLYFFLLIGSLQPIFSATEMINDEPVVSLGMEPMQMEKTAFTACLDHPQTYSAGQTLIFNKILYNKNNGYNVNTGLFTARSDGPYMFSFHIEHWATPELPVHLIVDNERQVSAVTAPHGTSTQAGNTIVLGLRAGQRVWIWLEKDGQLYGSDTFRGTCFSGAFINWS